MIMTRTLRAEVCCFSRTPADPTTFRRGAGGVIRSLRGAEPLPGLDSVSDRLRTEIGDFLRRRCFKINVAPGEPSSAKLLV